MILHLYRLSLSPRKEPTLFDGNDERFKRHSREEHLKLFFGSNLDYYPKKNSSLKYIATDIEETIITGVIARQINEVKRSDADDPFREVEGIEWETANLFLNIGEDEQVIGVEVNRKISARSRTIIQDLVRAINDKSPEGSYKIDVFPMHSGDEFWEKVSDYGGQITSLSFDLVVPNPPDATSATKEALRNLQEELNLRRVKETYENPEGLDLQNSFVKGREKYASSGGGDVKAKSGKETVYDSKDKVRKVYVDDDFKATGKPRYGLAELFKSVLRR